LAARYGEMLFSDALKAGGIANAFVLVRSVLQTYNENSLFLATR
jgi:hypothetical protein